MGIFREFLLAFRGIGDAIVRMEKCNCEHRPCILLIPGEAAHQNEMMSPVVTE